MAAAISPASDRYRRPDRKVIQAKTREELYGHARDRPRAARRTLLGAAMVQGGAQRRLLGQVRLPRRQAQV